MTKEQIAELIDRVASAKVWMKYAIDNHGRYEEEAVYQKKLNDATDEIYDEIWRYKMDTPPYNGSYSTLRGNY